MFAALDPQDILEATDITIFDDRVNDMTALMVACIDGRDDCVHALIGKKVDINAADKYGITALMHATHGSPSCLAILIKAGADVNQTEINGWTALTNSVDLASLSCIVQLLDNGADPDCQDRYGMTPLMYSCGHDSLGYLECTKQLIEYSADVNIQDNNGQTALMWASRGNCLRTASLLLNSDVDTAITDSNGQTAYDLAKTSAMKELLSYFVPNRPYFLK